MKQRNRMVTGLALVAILLVALTSPVWAQGPVTRITNAIIGTLTVSGSATAGNDLTATDDLLALDDLNITDDATVNGDMVIGGNTIAAVGTSITVLNSVPVTPTTGFVRLQATGTVTPSMVLTGTAGQFITLFNATNSSIVFADSGSLKLTGNITLGQYDTLSLVSDGTNWLMRGTANN